MEAIVRVEGVTFSYAQRNEATLKNISFQMRKGEFVLLTGASGCGKSTLLKTLNGLIPRESGGRFSGNVHIAGQNTRKAAVADISRIVGMVFQSPEDQIFSSTIFDEVSFVLENMGLTPKEIAPRVAEALRAVGLEGREKSSVHALSGGQKQRLAVAAVLAAKPQALALDEPISQIDPANAAKLLELLTRLNKEEHTAILLVEHRLHEALHVCDRVIVMDAGQIVWDGPAREMMIKPDILTNYGLRLPQVIDVCHRLKVGLTDDVQEAATKIRAKFLAKNTKNRITHIAEKPPQSHASVIFEMRNVDFSYDGKQNILHNINLSVHQGEIIALMGTNGAGKSTLLQQIAGILQPDKGKVVFRGSPVAARGQVGFIMQNPDFMLFNRTVKDEVLFGPRQMRKHIADENLLYEEIAARLALNGMAGDFPLGLSRGQRLRVAIASTLSFAPEILLLDEPTTGQDISRIGDILAALKKYAHEGGTVVFCTHDAEIAASFARRVILMQDGRIIADASPVDVFDDAALLKRAGLKQPPVMSLAALLSMKGALSVEEVVAKIE